MKSSVNFYDFSNALSGHFSYDAMLALFDYYEEMEEDMGQEITFDPVAIRCDWSEYVSLKAVQDDYPSIGIESVEDIMDHGNVVVLPNDNWRDFLKEFPQYYGEDFCSAGLLVTQF